MMMSWNGNIFRVTGHLCGEFPEFPAQFTEFPAQRPVTRSFDVFFDLCLNKVKRLSKQSWGWGFAMLSRPLWRHYNVDMFHYCLLYSLLKRKWKLKIISQFDFIVFELKWRSWIKNSYSHRLNPSNSSTISITKLYVDKGTLLTDMQQTWSNKLIFGWTKLVTGPETPRDSSQLERYRKKNIKTVLL